MKKVLVGICGIGNGHINRQICVIKVLIEHGYKLLIATEKEKIETLKNIFPNEKIIELTIPWIVCDKDGLNYKETLNKYNNIDYFRKYLEFGINVEKELNGKPDLVISDYEPNVAQYAYSANIPLITMEQQSKFLYLDEIKIDNHSIEEEKYRLNYFFPRYDKKIISSFFPIDFEKSDVIQVPPIISSISKKETKEDFILVYLSSYSNSYKYKKLLEIIRDLKNKEFKVYSNNYEEYEKEYSSSNIEYSNFNINFKNDLSICSCLLATSGHQLISEAISLNIPIYVFPLETYEQHYNALMVEKYKLGTNKEITKENIEEFISKRKEYEENIIDYKKKYYKKSWEKTFIKEINKII